MSKNKNIKFIKPSAHGIDLKKYYGQHFLRENWVIEAILKNVTLTNESSVFEIGCGDGFLTKSILQTQVKRLWVFEIDPQWAEYVYKTYPDNRMTIFQENILDVDFSKFKPYSPWTLLANIPYQITFPLLYKLIENRELINEGVIMIQEEVAQKITSVYGRNYGYQSLKMQYYFDLKLLDKILPQAFYPPPKVNSRLVYFKPKKKLDIIDNEQGFWQFIKRCFSSPRRTLKNNLQSCHYDLSVLSEEILGLRAQQISYVDLLMVWNCLNKVN